MKFTAITAAATLAAFVAALPAGPRHASDRPAYHLPHNNHHAPNATAPLYKPKDLGERADIGLNTHIKSRDDNDHGDDASSGGLATLAEELVIKDTGVRNLNVAVNIKPPGNGAGGSYARRDDPTGDLPAGDVPGGDLPTEDGAGALKELESENITQLG